MIIHIKVDLPTDQAQALARTIRCEESRDAEPAMHLTAKIEEALALCLIERMHLATWPSVQVIILDPSSYIEQEETDDHTDESPR